MVRLDVKALEILEEMIGSACEGDPRVHARAGRLAGWQSRRCASQARAPSGAARRGAAQLKLMMRGGGLQ